MMIIGQTNISASPLLPPLIWVNRPNVHAEETILALKNKGINVVAAQMMEYNFLPLSSNLKEQLLISEGLIFTSTAPLLHPGFQEYISLIKEKPILVVGKKTAQALFNHGFSQIDYIAQDAKQLLPTLTKQKNWIYISGTPRRNVIEEHCRAENIYIDILSIYESRYRSTLPESVCKLCLENQQFGVLLFSKSAAEAIIKAFENFLQKQKPKCLFDMQLITFYSLSDGIGRSIAAKGWHNVNAKRPDLESLLECLPHSP